MTYTTIAGDKWDLIAHKIMGDCNYTDRFIKANIEYRDIYIFPAGIVLDIPEVQKKPLFPLPPWKQKVSE